MPPMKRAVCILAVAATGCGVASDPEDGTKAKGTTGVRKCSDPALRPDSLPGTFVAGRVFFGGSGEPGWRQGDTLQSRPSGRSGERDFSKIGIFLRGNVRIVLRVPEEELRNVRVDYNVKESFYFRRAGPPTTVLPKVQRITGRCAEQRWWGYPGGFYFQRPTCLLLAVEVEGQTGRIPFGLGRPCTARERAAARSTSASYTGAS